MASQDRITLKNHFTPGAQPSSAEFGNLIDSFASVFESNGNAYIFPLMEIVGDNKIRKKNPESENDTEEPIVPKPGQMIWTDEGFKFMMEHPGIR